MTMPGSPTTDTPDHVVRRDLIPAGDRIARVRVATIGAALPEPIRFADWVMREREFALVRVESESGCFGHAFTLTRDGPVASMIERTIAHHYVGKPFVRPEQLFSAAQLASLSIHVSGAGLRALSIVDLATWDLAARAAGLSIAELLGGKPLEARHPATAIVGYPPTRDGAAVEAQVGELYERGWRRFKLPVAADRHMTHDRFRAAKGVAADTHVAMDAAWVFRDVDSAVEMVEEIQDDLGWYEDVFPPGDAGIVRALRDRVRVPIAMGDEQGGAYYPDALIAAGAVDIVRLDATCMGGLTTFVRLVDQVRASGLGFAPHMFPHMHSQLLGALGHEDVPIEWGVPWTGVHLYDDSLTQPSVSNGRMEPIFTEELGFGPLVNAAWIAEQRLDDPHGLIPDLVEQR
jgi:L-alanine-DL-glutamate epimerase-like enolase superfamily enzyme